MLLQALFPGGGADSFTSNRPQNLLHLCTFLRQRLQRKSYPWHKHPDCSQYNGNNGCMLVLPITVLGFNQNNPYPTMLDFLVDFQQAQAGQGADAQRHAVYGLLNDAIGGPRGKVRSARVWHDCFIISDVLGIIVRAQGCRQPLPLCVMLLVQRVLGNSVTGYDPGANGIKYDHGDWLARKEPPPIDSDDSDDDGGPECFVTTFRGQTGTRERHWTCDGDPRLVGELFCHKCLDHLD